MKGRKFEKFFFFPKILSMKSLFTKNLQEFFHEGKAKLANEIQEIEQVKIYRSTWSNNTA
jgi:hypothetical protein